MKRARDLSIPVVELTFLDAVKEASSDQSLVSLITKNNIAPWDWSEVSVFIYFRCWRIIITLIQTID